MSGDDAATVAGSGTSGAVPGATEAAGRLARLPGLAGRAARLGPTEWAATMWAAVLFGLAELSVRFRPMAWSAARFGVSLTPPPADADAAERAPLSRREQRGIRAVQRLSPRIYGSERGCLRRSLVMGHVLRAHDPVMRIGVRKTEGRFAAHAWIEVAGEAIEAGNDDYLPFEPEYQSP